MPDSNDNRNAFSEKNGFHPIVPANFLSAKKDIYSDDHPSAPSALLCST